MNIHYNPWISCNMAHHLHFIFILKCYLFKLMPSFLTRSWFWWVLWSCKCCVPCDWSVTEWSKVLDTCKIKLDNIGWYYLITFDCYGGRVSFTENEFLLELDMW